MSSDKTADTIKNNHVNIDIRNNPTAVSCVVSRVWGVARTDPYTFLLCDTYITIYPIRLTRSLSLYRIPIDIV